MNLQITIPKNWQNDNFVNWHFKIEQKLRKSKLGYSNNPKKDELDKNLILE